MAIRWKRRRRLRWCSGCLRRLSGANAAAAPHRRPVIPNENSVTRVPPADTESAQSDTLPAAPFHSFNAWAEVSGRALTVAAFFSHRHTRIMGVSLKRIFLPLVLCLAALSARADEIRLKDGKKLYGVIVSFEDNMFKVKTDFGYVLVEKDKIASIIPVAPTTGSGSEGQAAAKNAPDPAKSNSSKQPKSEPAVASAAESSPTAANATAKTLVAAAGKNDKSPKITNAEAKSELPAASSARDPMAPGVKGTPAAANRTPAAANSTPPAVTTQPAPPKEPEVPAIREDVQGNVYTNYTHGFRMYKAPSWQLIDDARNALPNAIVAMGTSSQSSLMVVGREKTKEPLEAAAVTVEKRLREVYENYQRISQRKTVVGGSPAIEFHYRGKADEHDWSGTLAVISHGGDIFTPLGMTYADNDLIQIQENVIAKAITSLSFDVVEVKK